MNLIAILSLILFVKLVCGSREPISRIKCAEYNKFSKKYNGSGVEFPFLVKLRNGEYYYSGILISEKFVLSVTRTHFANTVILGHSNPMGFQSYNIKRTFVHPLFGNNPAFGKFELYELDETVAFSKYVRPACLSLENLPRSGDLLQIGCGSTNIRVTSEFISYIGENGLFYSVPEVGSRKIFNDIGSAVIRVNRHTSKNDVIGLLVSSSTTENAILSVSVRFTAYIDWIEKTVWPEVTTKAPKTTTPKNVQIESKVRPTEATEENHISEDIIKFLYAALASLVLILLAATARYFFKSESAEVMRFFFKSES